RAGASQDAGSPGCAQDGRKRRGNDDRAVVEKDCPIRRLSGTQRRWAPRMENALARMAPSARSVGRGPTGDSTFTRRLKLWATVRARTSHRPYYATLNHSTKFVHSRGDGLSSPWSPRNNLMRTQNSEETDMYLYAIMS